MIKTCKKHGPQKYNPHNKCRLCSIESVDRSRKNKKYKLVKEFGGKCRVCGYSKSIRALQFHHIDPTTKEFDLSGIGRSFSYERQLKEAKKCIMVCANCHMEIEDGTIIIAAGWSSLECSSVS